MMILRVMVRTPEQPNELVPLENPLYGYIFNMDRAKWDNDLQFSWEGMFGDVVSGPSPEFIKTYLWEFPVPSTNHDTPHHSGFVAGRHDGSPIRQ
jgi:hypothetical protein